MAIEPVEARFSDDVRRPEEEYRNEEEGRDFSEEEYQRYMEERAPDIMEEIGPEVTQMSEQVSAIEQSSDIHLQEMIYDSKTIETQTEAEPTGDERVTERRKKVNDLRKEPGRKKRWMSKKTAALVTMGLLGSGITAIVMYIIRRKNKYLPTPSGFTQEDADRVEQLIEAVKNEPDNIFWPRIANYIRTNKPSYAEQELIAGFVKTISDVPTSGDYAQGQVSDLDTLMWSDELLTQVPSDLTTSSQVGGFCFEQGYRLVGTTNTAGSIEPLPRYWAGEVLEYAIAEIKDQSS
ncbi:hypothetical protein SCOR_24305 [Sulfidibacter corallicola]|uniref:Uncharacterized protein n=1 Tax=Sulfidibacter corallicola TaxID=2818388 RepID=A0A8A4TTN8_SULCO|nr:hypothetical protein [Sulfidibacter corallicola]QTD52468.1 hypothetical protein J3U87_08350 [Sulfidibacter corallicola]